MSLLKMLLFPWAVVALSSLRDRFTAELHKEMDAFVNATQAGAWFGLRTENETFGVALGSSDGMGTPAANTNIIPMGSYAKPWTGAAIMRLIEQGKFSLDDPFVPLIDPYLMQINKTTMVQLGWNATIINRVTVRQLLHMTSGLENYDDAIILKDTLDYPDWDITPQDYLHFNSKKFMFPPGTKSHYVSMNYLLLGLIWARYAGAQDWDGLDMLNDLIPESTKAQSPTNYNHTQFFRRGRCASYKNVIPYFEYRGINKTTHFPIFANMSERSCLNGFAFGNSGSSATDAASFMYDLLGPVPRVVSGDIVKQMMNFSGSPVSGNAIYGLGIWKAQGLSLESYRQLNMTYINKTLDPNLLIYYGHAGDDYGTISRQGWHKTLKFAFSFIVNSQYSMEKIPFAPIPCASVLKHKERVPCVSKHTTAPACISRHCCYDATVNGSHPNCFAQPRPKIGNMHTLYCKLWKVIFTVYLGETYTDIYKAFLC